MESYRIKNGTKDQRRKLLLPLSGGVSSVILLQILDSQLEKQLTSRGRSAYDLHVLMIDTSLLDPGQAAKERFELLKDQFSSYSYYLLPLADVFKDELETLDALSRLGYTAIRDGDAQGTLVRLMSQISTPSSRTDMQDILLTRLIVKFAKSRQCEAILWGHSDSRLAAKVLTSVANGRGAALSSQIRDGPTPWEVTFNYPLRDLLKSELVLYSILFSRQVAELIVHDVEPSTSSVPIRNLAIQDVLTVYINAQVEKYPSIMANIVRTVNKLQELGVSDGASTCYLCQGPFKLGSGHSGVDLAHTSEDLRRNFCYACLHIGLDIKTHASGRESSILVK